MPYSAKVILDSINPYGERITTMECTYPRFIHSEMLTHRMFSRNSSSSRAIPNKKLIERVMNDPVIPVSWGKNQKGMQAGEELIEESVVVAKGIWLEARDKAVYLSEILSGLGVHKQLANRIIEPWMYITVIITATEWENFWKLRCHPDAQPEMQKIAYMMKEVYDSSTPVELGVGEWHLPYMQRGSDFVRNLKIQSVASCARVSYLNHDGTKSNLIKDTELFSRLKQSGHWSPFEHVASACTCEDYHANFKGWRSFRVELGA